jgi:arylformamidase
MTEYRAILDAEITFGNGGGLRAQDFRLDLPGPQVSEEELAGMLVDHLGLLVVETVRVRNVRVVAEPHRGSRGGPAGPARSDRRWRMVELNHVVTAGMTTYPGLPGPEIAQHLSREDSRGMYAPGVEFAVDRISMVGNTGTYLDSPFHRYADGSTWPGCRSPRSRTCPWRWYGT